MVKSLTDITVALLLACCLIFSQSQTPSQAQAQDLLRQRQQNTPTNNNNNNLNPLASIQLPPELASLTPQQLHQLAQLRELQIQQAAANQQGSNNNNNNNQAANAPAPIGTETLPTTQPSASNNAQIPQPNAASFSTAGSNQSGSQNSDSSDRHDDGAYNESGSEMEGVMQSGNEATGTSTSPATSSSSTSGNSNPTSAAPTFEVNWNKCPQLEPSESEKSKKTQVITKCLQSAPIPTNLTRENVETHREQIATCALKVEGWFDDQGNYKYDKAESEIRGKKLESSIELQVLKFHVACKDEASKKFPRDQNKLIDQVQFYQACMDYYISIVCEIEVSVDQ